MLGLGVLALLSGALLAVLWFRQPSTAAGPVTATIPSTFILVAAQAIPAGTLLRLDEMKWAAVPATEVTGATIVGGNPATAAAQNDILLGAYVGAESRHAFAAGAPLTSDSLVKPGAADFLGVALHPGYRAISINVSAAQSTSGLIAPGDRVDVILTQSFPVQGTNGNHRSVGETVLHDLRVIAVGQRLGPPAPAAAVTNAQVESQIPTTVTLEVTERQAETLMVAQELGKIQLSLLGLADQEAARSAVARPVPAAWASDVSPATATTTVGTQAATVGTLGGPITVMHGAKNERICVTSTGLIPCP
jgi:pilus assembly protein CpaB